MHLSNTLLLILFLSIFSFGCGNSDSKSNNATAKNPATTNAATSKPKALGAWTTNTFPSIDQAMMEKIWNECTNVDYLFYDMNFSMNQTEPGSIKNMLTFISTAVPEELDSGCKPVGRVFLVGNGEELAEADFYLGTTCNYFIFFVDGKQTFANKMTPKGEEFLKNTIKQVQGGMPK